MTLFWTASSLVPLLVLFHQRSDIGGWNWPQALLVVAFFTMLRGVIEGGIQPALQNVVELVRKGMLDFLLLKPADAQFLVSTSRFEIWRGVDVLAGFAILIWALVELRHVPTPGQLAATLSLLVGAIVILYSIWIAVVALALRVVKVDNLTYFFSSVFEAARWPAPVFRGVLAFVFTFVIPLIVMTSFPALAIVGELEGRAIVFSLGGALLFALAARLLWLRALRSYTSAGG
jgi:ABC-2 type transport system permease protein